MIRILYYGLSWFQGGIECYLYKICRCLNREKYEIAFIDEENGHTAFRRELEDLGAIFYDITPRRISVTQNKIDLKMLFIAEHFDIIHFNCNTLSYVTPIIIAQKYGIKILLHSRNSKCATSPITIALHYLNKVRLKRFNIMRIAVSESAGKWLFGKASYKVLNNGIEVQRFTFDIGKRNAVRQKMGLVDKNVYCNVGVFFKVKNHFFLLKIFEKIISKNKNAFLLLAGDGPLRSQIEEYLRKLKLINNVCLLGKVNNVAEILMASDCMIFPSLYEGFPNAVLEAETTGLPVLMSDVITEEVCLTDQCVRMPLSKSAQEWADRAEKLVGIPWNREAGAEIIVRKGYSTNSEIKKIEAIYQELIRA